DGDGSHGSTSKTPSYTKSVSWHHYPAVNKKELECIKETISKYCAKFTRKEAILTPPAHFNKTSITSDCWQILFFSPDHFNNYFY
ncbi:hypothetical protein RNO97_13095, partial [Escherichia coli]|nr:hypothetical protein [Escherichia coli]